MRRELLDVEQAKPMASQHGLGAQDRVVHEMLVVDGVELVVLDQSDEVGRPRSTAARPGRSRVASPAVKSFRSGTCAKTLLATT